MDLHTAYIVSWIVYCFFFLVGLVKTIDKHPLGTSVGASLLVGAFFGAISLFCIVPIALLSN